MNNIFIHKHTNEHVNLINMGKMKESNETVVIYELEHDRTIMVISLNKFNHDYEQHEFSNHDHFIEHVS